MTSRIFTLQAMNLFRRSRKVPYLIIQKATNREEKEAEDSNKNPLEGSKERKKSDTDKMKEGNEAHDRIKFEKGKDSEISSYSSSLPTYIR